MAVTVRHFNMNSGLCNASDCASFPDGLAKKGQLQTQPAETQRWVSQGNMVPPTLSNLLKAHMELTVDMFALFLFKVVVVSIGIQFQIFVSSQ